MRPLLTFAPQKADPAYGEYRALPLVNTEKLLAFINTKAIPGQDDDIQFDLPFTMPTLEEPYAVVSTAPVLTAGGAPACPDLILHSEEVQSSKAYVITIGDAQQVPSCLPLTPFARLTPGVAGGHHETLLLHPGNPGTQAPRPGRAHRLPEPQVAAGRGMSRALRWQVRFQ